jgi:hypothetical protein
VTSARTSAGTSASVWEENATIFSSASTLPD